MNVPHKLKTFLDDVLLKAFSEIGDGVGVLEGSTLIFANEAFCKMSGFTEEELLALPSFFQLFPADENQDLPKKILTRPKGRKSLERHEAVLKDRQGKKV